MLALIENAISWKRLEKPCHEILHDSLGEDKDVRILLAVAEVVEIEFVDLRVQRMN